MGIYGRGRKMNIFLVIEFLRTEMLRNPVVSSFVTVITDYSFILSHAFVISINFIISMIFFGITSKCRFVIYYIYIYNIIKIFFPFFTAS